MDTQGDSESATTTTAAAAATAATDALPLADTPAAAALREDQIQNAVTFLSHPKVRGSAETAKRTFLEKKGLTSAEIEEAFRRVPPEAGAVAPTTTSTPTVGANNLVTYTQQPQPQPQPQHAQAAPHHPQLPPSQALVPAQQMQLMHPQRPPVHWSQVVLGVGVAAAGVYGLHQLLAPRLSAWSQQLFASRRAAAEAEAERAAALTAALERLSEGQSRLQDTLESLTAAVKQQQQLGLGLAESQADYLACQSPSLGPKRHNHHSHHQQQQQQYFGGGGYGGGDTHSGYYGGGGGGPRSTGDNYASSSRAAVVRGGGSGWDPYAPITTDTSASYRAPSETGRPGSAASPSGRTPGPAGGPSGFYGSSATGFEVTPPPTSNNRAPQPPAQYQQGYGSNNGNSSTTNNPNNIPAGKDPGYARRAAGAYAGPEASTSGQQRAGGVDGSGSGPPSTSASRPEEAPRSAAFHEVMAMVQAGITPPNVRTDIDDNPPDPSRPLSAPQMPPRAKPWESAAAAVSNGGLLGTPGAAYSSNAVVPDGPSGFGVRPYGADGAAAAAAATPTSAPHDEAGGAGVGGVGSSTMDVVGATGSSSSTSRFDVPPEKAAVGYDLSQLLGADSARDAPWRPPPPPAATVQRPLSSGSSTNKAPAAAADAALADAPPPPPPGAAEAGAAGGAEADAQPAPPPLEPQPPVAPMAPADAAAADADGVNSTAEVGQAA